MAQSPWTIVVAGGAGHVGLPLSLVLAQENPHWQIVVYDIDSRAIEKINQATLPFMEAGATPILKQVLGKNLRATTSVDAIECADVVITVIGTPIDAHLNPRYSLIEKFLAEITPKLQPHATLILRSTVYPGTTDKIGRYLKEQGLEGNVAYCPERIAEGHAMRELRALPQIVSGLTGEALGVAKKLFGSFTSELVELAPKEAELSKLMTNSWRYIQFATANQFYMLASAHDLDFYKIYHAITHNYPRTVGFPKAGFAAGPCLLKDTMQLSAFAQNQFFLGHGAMLVNEGLPNFIVSQMKKDHPHLHELKVGILGMAFKAGSDDNRDSLSYKLKHTLSFHAKEVLCSDEYFREDKFISASELLLSADLIVVGVPHEAYMELLQKTTKPIYDVWDVKVKEVQCQAPQLRVA